MSLFITPAGSSKYNRLPMRCVLNNPTRVRATGVMTRLYGRGTGSGAGAPGSCPGAPAGGCPAVGCGRVVSVGAWAAAAGFVGAGARLPVVVGREQLATTSRPAAACALRGKRMMVNAEGTCDERALGREGRRPVGGS